METVFFGLYNTFLPLFWIFVHCWSIFNKKVKRALIGRRFLFETLRSSVQLLAQKRVWIHVSSMGEFEQAKPIIRLFKEQHPQWSIVVSFFSPSGYEHSRNYKLADLIVYHPFDSVKNAKQFLSLIRPSLAIFIRYDLWPNHIRELHRLRVPIVLANATLSFQSHRFFPFVKTFHHYLFNMLSYILTVSKSDALAFQRFVLSSPTVAVMGDTRYDQVLQRSNDVRQQHLIAEPIVTNKKIFIAGSTWPEDEAILIPTLKKVLQYRSDVLAIIVPHEPTLEALEAIERQFDNGISTIRFSNLNDYTNERVIIVDSVGILMGLYKYGTVAYVGGSFKQGVHNVLEPAVYGIPVLFGPRHTNSQEAQQLVECGGAFVIHESTDCYRTLCTLFDYEDQRVIAGRQALTFVKSHIGATEQLFTYIQNLLT
ncbi:MAG: 3-deoxy-D-manno-octulosonic acid transferase [Bacteroidetes bacterium]|nr:3-deoxy-D-manno-octulosonic acid transferase [Bacteroidota bacterium]